MNLKYHFMIKLNHLIILIHYFQSRWRVIHSSFFILLNLFAAVMVDLLYTSSYKLSMGISLPDLIFLTLENTYNLRLWSHRNKLHVGYFFLLFSVYIVISNFCWHSWQLVLAFWNACMRQLIINNQCILPYIPLNSTSNSTGSNKLLCSML